MNARQARARKEANITRRVVSSERYAGPMALAGIRFPLRNSCRASSPLPETTSSVSAKARPPSRGRRKSSKARSSLPLKGKGACPPSEGMTRGGFPGMRTEQPNPVPGPMAAMTPWPEDFMPQ